MKISKTTMFALLAVEMIVTTAIFLLLTLRRYEASIRTEVIITATVMTLALLGVAAVMNWGGKWR